MLFDRTVSITGTVGTVSVRTSAPACIVDDGAGDPLSDGAQDTDVTNICVFIRRADWRESVLPAVGFTVKDETGATFAVRRVTHLGDCLSISARSV